MNEREAFEEWLKDSGVSYREDVAWAAWQAGRAPLLKEIEQLNAKVAMMRETVRKWHTLCLDNGRASTELAIPSRALSATEQDVTRWVNGVKADALDECYSMLDSLGKDYTLPRLKDLMAKQLRGEHD